MKDKFVIFVRENPLLFSALLSAVLICVSWLVAEIANRIESKIESTAGTSTDFSAVIVFLFITVIVYSAIRLLILHGRL